MSQAKNADWDGPTYNGVPYVKRDSSLIVACTRDRDITDETCGWTGPVSDLDRGRVPIGSRPVWLRCPECGKGPVAAERGTTSAGYWSGVLPD